MLSKVKTRTGIEYDKLKKIVPDIDDRKLISQMQFCVPGLAPPCSAKGEYFIADQVWIKYDARGRIEDMVIVDTKLSEGTAFTSGQGLAKGQVGGTLTYKPQVPKEFDEVDNVRLPIDIQQGQEIQVKAFYKMYGDGDKTFLGIK